MESFELEGIFKSHPSPTPLQQTGISTITYDTAYHISSAYHITDVFIHILIHIYSCHLCSDIKGTISPKDRERQRAIPLICQTYHRHPVTMT